LAISTKEQKIGAVKEKVNDNIIGDTLKPFAGAVPGGPVGL
jgi:hypothetical protein